MDNKLLLELFRLPSQSGKEELVQNFIVEYLTKYNIPYFIDDFGNIFNISYNEKPMLSAHMDTVQDDDDTLMAKYIDIKDGILSGYGVIGGDDKCGIYIILKMLVNNDIGSFNFVFTVQEEIGAHGSSYFEQNNDLTHMLYCLVLDRKGSGDILCATGHYYGTKEFEKALSDFGNSYGYTPATGSFCDADNFNEQLSCCNLSVGYYNAHTKQEFVVLEQLENSLKYVSSIVTNLDVKYEAPDTYSRRTTSSIAAPYDNYYDDEYWEEKYGYSSINSGATQSTSLADLSDDELDELFGGFDDLEKPSNSLPIDRKDASGMCKLCKNKTAYGYVASLDIELCEDCMEAIADDIDLILYGDYKKGVI